MEPSDFEAPVEPPYPNEWFVRCFGEAPHAETEMGEPITGWMLCHECGALVQRAMGSPHASWHKRFEDGVSHPLVTMDPVPATDGELTGILMSFHRALTDQGIDPNHHHLVKMRHRAEWPVLWNALDRLYAYTVRRF